MPPDRHLLVDAYNVIHAWPELRAALLNHGPDAARAQLADALRPIHDVAGWRVSLVFDGKGSDLVIERPGPELTFSYVYGSAGLTADAVIEQVVTNSTLSAQEDRRPRSRRREPPELVVATRDNLLGEATAACGARTLSPDGLRDWVRSLADQQTRTLLTRQRRAARDWQSGSSPWDKLNKPPAS
jgi:predicted RNA-binding protein with PIN domain